jgi:hypothetical protein
VISLPDAGTEAETERDGLLSYAGEWHALIIGGGAGFGSAVTGAPEAAGAVALAALGLRAGKRLRGRGVLAEIRREPWYAIGGTALGYAVGLAPVILP